MIPLDEWPSFWLIGAIGSDQSRALTIVELASKAFLDPRDVVLLRLAAELEA